MRVYEPNSSTYQKVIAFSHVQGVLIFTWDKTKYKYAVPVLIQPVGLLKEADTEDNYTSVAEWKTGAFLFGWMLMA